MAEILQGDLAAVRLGSVLQICELEALTARVSVGAAGHVGVHDGEIVEAQSRALHGTRALLELFLLPAGRFSITPMAIRSGRPIGSLMGLVIEGSRLLDEWNRLAGFVLVRSPSASATDAPGLEDLWERIDGKRALWRVCADAGVARSAIIDPVIDALRGGVLDHVDTLEPEPVAPDDAPAPLHAVAAAAPPPPVVPTAKVVLPPRAAEPSPATAAAATAPATNGVASAKAVLPGKVAPVGPSLDDLLTRGRQAVRVRDFEAAEAAFREALSVDPHSTLARQNLRRIEHLRHEHALGVS